MKKEKIIIGSVLLSLLLAGCSSATRSSEEYTKKTAEGGQTTEQVVTEQVTTEQTATEQATTEQTATEQNTIEETTTEEIKEKTNNSEIKDSEADQTENKTVTENKIEAGATEVEGAFIEDDESEAKLGTPKSKAVEEDWKTAYVDYLNNVSDVDNQDGYTLIDMDGDAIPELVEVGMSEAAGIRIVNYSNGEVHVNDLNRLDFTYIKGKNLLCNSGGLMDSYYDLVYSIVDGELTLVAQGHYGAEDNTNVQFDADGYPIYVYTWDGEDVSEEEYQKELSKVYDSSKAVPGYDSDKLESLKDIIADIESR